MEFEMNYINILCKSVACNFSESAFEANIFRASDVNLTSVVSISIFEKH